MSNEAKCGPVEKRLQAAMDCEAHDGTSSDKFIFHRQVREGIAELIDLRSRSDRLAAENKELIETLVEAREMVADWGLYASEYFREKHGLVGDLEKLDAILAKVKEQT